MLAGQRLRRAATYAVDRQLLRQLIEDPALFASAQSVATAPDPTAERPFDPEPEVNCLATQEFPAASETALSALAAILPIGDSASAEASGPVEMVVEEQLPLPVVEAPTALSDEEQPESIVQAEPVAVQDQDQPSSSAFLLAEPTTSEEEAIPAAEQPTAPVKSTETLAELSVTEAVLPVDASLDLTSAAVEVETMYTPAQPESFLEAPEDNYVTEELVTVIEQPSELISIASIVSEADTLTDEVAPTVEDETLPPVAPPIRPPVERGSSRFEFGLGLPDLVRQAVYELPTLEPQEESPAVETEATRATGFYGDALVGYALGDGGSRLGYCLQPTDAFTDVLPGTPFFAPDALLQEQTPRYQPASPPAPSPFDLINTFLRTQPRLRAPAVLPAAEEQADLSVRSTRGVPDIASESLAKIMVRQGKIEKAIEIYERLIVRQPEKKAYFADQIQQLKPTE
ncbi:hypothetical protein [Hymenobacter elongatus]|uniref:Uncharacterized protein n=1 Tax=Hymenobacter elongatus TaxID=877208 RepID=A0A4Z0PIB2_9BACT|nr:hypothetical protein [Hymenobacter elongatus]TGE14499.1 hypothetical protein E5J99_15665 [Hymenobacter elongatus]